MRRAAKISYTNYSIKNEGCQCVSEIFAANRKKNLECYKVLYVYKFLRSKPKNYLIIFIFYGIL